MEDNLFYASDLADHIDPHYLEGQSVESTPLRNQKHSSLSSRKDLLISWVNSLEYPNCLLASTIDDFKNGVIFCEIVNEVILRNQKPDFLSKINLARPGNEDMIRNFQLSLQEINENCRGFVPTHLQNAAPSEFIQNQEKILELLDFLYGIANNQAKLEDTVIARSNSLRQFDADHYTGTVKKASQPEPNLKNIPKPVVAISPNKSEPTSHQSQAINSTNRKPPLQSNNLFERNQFLSHGSNHKSTPVSGDAINIFNAASPLTNDYRHNADNGLANSQYQPSTAPHKPNHYPQNRGSTNAGSFTSNPFEKTPHNIIVNEFLDPDQNIYSSQFTPGPEFSSKISQSVVARPFTRKDTAGNSWISNDSLVTQPNSALQTFYNNQFQSSPASSSGNLHTFEANSTHGHSNVPSNRTLESIKIANTNKTQSLPQSQYVSPSKLNRTSERTSNHFISDSFSKSHKTQQSPESHLKQQYATVDYKTTPSQKPAPKSNSAIQDFPLQKREIAPLPQSRYSYSRQEKLKSGNLNDSFVLDQSNFSSKNFKDGSECKPLPNNSYKAQHQRSNSEAQHSRVSSRGLTQQSTTPKEERRTSYEEKKKPVPVVTKVDSFLKKKIIEWLVSITFLKDTAKDLESKLPRICRNGVIFIDLVNRLEGKNDTIKGISRHPQTKTQVNVNYSKVFSYLRGKPKMNPRYLWAEDYIIEGNEDIFWGLLYDIWCLYSQRISPYDPRYKDLQHKKEDQSQKPNASNTEKSALTTRHDDNYTEFLYTNHRDHSNNKSIRSLSPKGERSTSRTQDYSAIYAGNQSLTPTSKTQPNKSTSPRPIEATQRALIEHEEQIRADKGAEATKLPNKGTFSKGSEKFTIGGVSPLVSTRTHSPYRTSSPYHLSSQKTASRDEKPTDYVPNKIMRDYIVTFEMEQEVEFWLKQIGFQSYLARKERALFEDPLRNGVLLLNVITRIENEKMPSYYPRPETIDQCRKNVYGAFDILRRKKTPIPYYFSHQEEEILQGDYSAIWGLLYSLMRVSHDRGYQGGSIYSMHSPSKSISQDFSGKILPYSEEEIKKLEMSLLNWIVRMGVFGETHQVPLIFEELEIQLRNGTILCELISLVTHRQLHALVKKPVNEAQIIGNIRRGLEILREDKNMSQKYTWKERELHKGSKYYLLGFLEDLHRYFDGQPPRKNPNYYYDGPYYGQAGTPIKGSQNEDLATETRVKKTSPLVTRTYAQNNNQNIDLRTSKTLSHGRKSSEASTHKFQPDEPISLLNLAQQPIRLVNYSTITSTRGNENDPTIQNLNSLPQEGGITAAKPIFTGLNYRTAPKKIESSPRRNETSTMSTSRPGIGFSDGSNQQGVSFMQGAEDCSDIKDWLYSLNLEAVANEINFETEEILDFSDGVALCKILNKLEAREIPGIIAKPKTKGSRTVNIRKAFQVLSKRAEVDPRLLNREEEILEGKGTTIRALLRSIKRAYRTTVKCLSASKSLNAGITFSAKKIVERF